MSGSMWYGLLRFLNLLDDLTTYFPYSWDGASCCLSGAGFDPDPAQGSVHENYISKGNGVGNICGSSVFGKAEAVL